MKPHLFEGCGDEVVSADVQDSTFLLMTWEVDYFPKMSARIEYEACSGLGNVARIRNFWKGVSNGSHGPNAVRSGDEEQEAMVFAEKLDEARNCLFLVAFLPPLRHVTCYVGGPLATEGIMN